MQRLLVAYAQPNFYDEPGRYHPLRSEISPRGLQTIEALAASVDSAMATIGMTRDEPVGVAYETAARQTAELLGLRAHGVGALTLSPQLPSVPTETMIANQPPELPNFRLCIMSPRVMQAIHNHYAAQRRLAGKPLQLSADIDFAVVRQYDIPFRPLSKVV